MGRVNLNNSLRKTEEVSLQTDLLPIITERLSVGQSVCFFPKGVSMLPMIRQGMDKVVLSRLPERLKKYDIVLYRRKNGGLVLHRIVETGQTYTCLGDNQFRPEPGLEREQMIAVVTAFYRGKRMYSVKAPGYWLYCRVWYHTGKLRLFWRRGCNWLRRHLL